MLKNTKPEEWVKREVAIKELGIKPRSFSTYLSSGKIPAEAVKQGVTKFFHLPTLKGLN